MSREFDPIRSRKFWLDTPFMWSFEPGPGFKGLRQAGYYWSNVSSFVELNLLGLADRGRPILEGWIDRMERYPTATRSPLSRVSAVIRRQV